MAAAVMTSSEDIPKADLPADNHTTSMTAATTSTTTSSDYVPITTNPGCTMAAARTSSDEVISSGKVATFIDADAASPLPTPTHPLSCLLRCLPRRPRLKWSLKQHEVSTGPSDATPGTADIELTPQAVALSSAARGAMSSLERLAAPASATPDPTSPGAPEEKMWPRLHLLGLPRELRDEIYRYAVVSDQTVYIGPNVGSNECFIPALTKVSRQVRLEALRVFLEQNTLCVDGHALLMNPASKSLDAFKALCAGAELKNVTVCAERAHESIHGRVAWTIAPLILSKTKTGLEVVFDFCYTPDTLKICACCFEQLTHQHGDQDNAIVRLFEALREGYLKHGYSKRIGVDTGSLDYNKPSACWRCMEGRECLHHAFALQCRHHAFAVLYR